MKVGQKNVLHILRFTSVGAYLGDDADNDVLLPNKYLSDDLEVGNETEVFIYRDSEDRLVATTEEPFIQLNGFAYLKIKEVNFYGAFADWGLEKDLMIPFKEQQQRMEEDHYYLVSLRLDEATDRLYGTTRIAKFLEREPSHAVVGKVLPILVCDQSELGIKVIVDNQYQGLIYHSDIATPLRRGEVVEGYIYTIREDGKVDVRLGKPGYERIDEFSDKLLSILRKRKTIHLTDKSDPEEIREAVGMSKKAFKQAVGKLYKLRLITLSESSIDLVE